MLAGAEPGRGRVSQKLAELGPVWDLTTGGYFEGSTGVHKLIGVMTDSWAKKQLLATGRPPGEGELSLTTGLLRRRLSTAIVKANMSVLLGRLGMIGEGAALARKRRQWGQFVEARMRREGGGLEGGDNREAGGQEWTVLALMSIHSCETSMLVSIAVQRSLPPLSELRRNYASLVQTLAQTPALPCPCRPCHSLCCFPCQNSRPGRPAGGN